MGLPRDGSGAGEYSGPIQGAAREDVDDRQVGSGGREAANVKLAPGDRRVLGEKI